MKIPSHYLALKPFLDQTLFGCGDVDYYFRTMDKLKFTDQFIDYHSHFLDNRKDSHLLLLSQLSEYCKDIGMPERENLIKVVLENELIANTTALAVCLNEGQISNREQYTVTLLNGLQKFVKDGRLLYKVEFPGVFLRLNTRNGTIDRINLSKADPEPYITEPLVTPGDEQDGRFALHFSETKSTLVLIDRIDGRMWRVLIMSSNPEKRLVPYNY